MQLVMRRYRISHVWYKFLINARMIVNAEEAGLLTKYRLHNAIVTQGDMWRDIKLAALITFLLGFSTFGALNEYGYYYLIYDKLGLCAIALIFIGYIIYHQIREEVRVNDLLTGRDFKARSFIDLLNKEHKIRKMSDVFANVVNQARTWHEPEVIELAPQPLADVLEGFNRAVA